MSNGDHDNSLKIPKSLSKDQTDATESKDSPSMGMEGGGGSGLISNPLDVNINTVEVAVAPQLDVVILIIIYPQKRFFMQFPYGKKSVVCCRGAM